MFLVTVEDVNQVVFVVGLNTYIAHLFVSHVSAIGWQDFIDINLVTDAYFASWGLKICLFYYVNVCTSNNLSDEQCESLLKMLDWFTRAGSLQPQVSFIIWAALDLKWGPSAASWLTVTEHLASKKEATLHIQVNVFCHLSEDLLMSLCWWTGCYYRGNKCSDKLTKFYWKYINKTKAWRIKACMLQALFGTNAS